MMIARASLIALLASTAYAQTAPASWSVDCANLKTVDQYKQLELDEEQLLKDCVNSGKYDPPVEWRPPAGRTVGALGAGSVLTHGQNAPEAPPGNQGAPASVSNTRWGLAITMPPWQGFPCQLPGGISLCGGGGTGGASGGGSCPARTDTSGTFGQMIALNTLTSKALTCGGSVSLSSVPFSLFPNANYVAITGNDEYNLNVYKFNPATVKFELYDRVPLPQKLCKPGSGGTMEPSVQLEPPITQIFTYSDSTQYLNVRLKPKPGEMIFDPFQPSSGTVAEKYLSVPVQAGIPKNLASPCGNESHFTASPPATNDIDVIAVGGATGVADGEEVNSCDTSTLYPDGSACGNLMLVVVSDDPQLVHTPGTTAEFIPLNDRGEVMNKSTAGNILMVGDGTLIRLGGAGQSITLPDGGVIPLRNGNLLTVKGPVEIRGGSASITLTNGGQTDTPGGDRVSEYTAGATVTVDANLPFWIRPNNRVQIPAGLLVPGKSGGYLRLPVSSQ